MRATGVNTDEIGSRIMLNFVVVDSISIFDTNSVVLVIRPDFCGERAVEHRYAGIMSLNHAIWWSTESTVLVADLMKPLKCCFT